MSNNVDELVDFDDDEVFPQANEKAAKEAEPTTSKKADNLGHVAVHDSAFGDFLLKNELLRAIGDCGFEHPSEVQHQCIPEAILGSDLLCQAQSGMGKTAVFVLSVSIYLEKKMKITHPVSFSATPENSPSKFNSSSTDSKSTSHGSKQKFSTEEPQLLKTGIP